jgi:AraC-like DNA-binding protein
MAHAPGSRADFGRDVRQIVRGLLGDGRPDIRVIADAFRVSARTLQRRLREADLTYAGVVAEARCDMARKMLDVPAPKIADVARALGYSDAAHFTRAFLRWTGLTPREYRRRGRGDPGQPRRS